MENKTNFPDNNAIVVVHSVEFKFEDIHRTIESFYRQVAFDRHLRVPFAVVEDWPHHIERLTHFWWIRFGGKPYMDVQYNPIQKHYETGFNEDFLDIWLSLFKSTLNSTLNPGQSQIWMMFAESMGEALNRNNELMKRHYGTGQ